MNWLDNPYRTIIEMCEYSLVNEGKSIYDSLTKLLTELRDSDVDNPIVDRRISDALSYVTKNYNNEELNSKSFMTQNVILAKMTFCVKRRGVMKLILMEDTIKLLQEEGRQEELVEFDSMEGSFNTTEQGVNYIKYLIDD